MASVSKILDIQLNVQNMSVQEWLAYEEMAQETIKQQKQSKNGSTR